MRRSSLKTHVHPKNSLLSVALSSLLSAALILLPVLPPRPAHAAASKGRDRQPASAERLNAAPAAALAAPLVPAITATKTDSFADPNNDGKAEPGDTITYNVTITNNGTDATNVQFTDTVDPNTTLVPGSVATQPIASNDSYNVLGNVRIQPDAASGLLANDCDPDNVGPCSSAGLTASGPTSSAQGGNVTVNADGSFSYNPPAGYEGPDSFNYTVTDGSGKTDTATANFTVSKMVWFVDNDAAAGGDGRLTAPFNSLAPVNGAVDADKPFDVIYVLQGTSAYGGGIVLEDNQRLAGQGTSLDAALAVYGFPPAPPHSDTRPAAVGAPTITNAGGDAVTLADNNHVSYLNASASASGSAAITGNGAGGSTVVDSVGASASGAANGVSLPNHAGTLVVSNSSISGSGTGTAVLISGGSTAINFNNTTVSQNTGRVVDIQNRTGGSVSFGAGSTVTGTNGGTDAVVLLGNTGGSSVNFAAAVQLNTNAAGARGLVADSTGGFTLNMTGGGSALSSTGGAAVDLEDIAVNVTIATTFSTGSNSNGVRVNNITGSASFGNTAVNTSASTGVLLTNNSAGITFTDLDIAPASGQRALHATNNGGTVSSSSGTVTTTNAVAVEIEGASSASRSPLNMTLTSVSANGDSNGIILKNTNGPGSSVGFVVNGDGIDTTLGGNSSGGVIQNTTGADDDSPADAAGIGVRLVSADEVTLRRMTLTTQSNFGIYGENSSNFTFEYSKVNGTNGTAVGIGNPNNSDASVAFNELTGSALFKHSIIEGGLEDNVRVVNTAGTLDRITFDNFTLGAMDTATGENGVFIQARNSAVIKATVQNSNLTSARGDMLQFDLTNTASGELIFKDNTVNNQHPAIVTGGGGITLSGGGSATAAPTFVYDFEGNTFRGARGAALLVIMQVGSGSATGRIENNTFGVSGVDRSGSSEASTIDIRTTGRAAQTVLIDNNQIRQYSNHGILLQMGDQNAAGSTGTIGGMNATVTNNTIEQPSTATFNKNGVSVNFGTTTGDSYQGCFDIKNNNGANGGSNDANAAARDYLVRQRMVTTIRLPGYAGAPGDNLAVQAFIQGQNIGTETVFTSVQNVGVGGGGFVGGFPCLVPADLASFDAPDADNDFNEVAATTSDVKTVADARQTAQGGFAADREFASAGKIRRGFANSERGQLLGAGMGESDETSKTVRAAAPVTATLAGETVTVNVGTLRAGDSVTITFQVTVADPFTGSQPQVSNQGTVTADGGVSVPTDDPSEPGAADPTVTPILLPPTININDATAAEPTSGSASMSFTVSLSHPFTQPVTVDFATAGGSATAGADYTTTSGTLTYAAGETVKTINVPVLSDPNPAEGNETFIVNLSDPDNGTVGDGTATGTITDESVASPVIISELRTSGPGGSNDDFVELLNTTDSDITVNGGWSIVKSGAGCSTTPVIVGVVPNGAVIRARGNYLLAGSAYSLGAYAAPDVTLSADIEDDHNVGLFTTTDLLSISSVNRYDAVGFGTNVGENCDLLREGNNLPAALGSTSEHSFVRKVTLGQTHDAGDNAADFVVVSTTPSVAVGNNSTPTLGAPGPEGGTSPTGPVPCAEPSGSQLFGRAPVDTAVSGGSAPNTVRDATPVTNGSLGTLDFRRTFTNNTGAPVTRLRFRAVDLSTFPSGGDADLRALSSATTVVSTTGGPVTVNGTTLETPPAQASGGGVNSSLAAGSITLATPLPAGASVSLRFLFGVEQVGDYNIAFVLEALPGPSGQDIWKLSGHTETGGHTDGGCNEPPIADAGPDQTAECSDGQASVTLDGSLSSDPDGDTPLSFEWKEGATSLGTGQTLNVTLASGSHTITLTVTDPSGASSQDTVVVNVVDTLAPTVNDPPDVTVFTGPGASSCGAVVSDAMLGTASATDGCEGSLPVNRAGVPAGNFFPVGTTQVTYTATDAAGNTGMATQNVTVIDNTPPVVTPPANIVASADANSCSATLNPGTASANDNCGGSTVVGVRSDSQPLNSPYPVGTTTITWTATDNNGNQASASQTVTVQDNQAPTVTSSVAVTTMGPPFNHAMINVGLAASATDNCPVLGPLQVSVYSDEDDGTGPHSPDALGIGVGTLKLRRERDGTSNGRVYLVVVKATDASGNTAVSCKTVTVPLSNSAGDAASVASQAASASAFCSANGGAAPSGYSAVGP